MSPFAVFRSISGHQLEVAVNIILVIILVMVVWLMVDANSQMANKSQVGAITAGIVLFSTISIGFKVWKYYIEHDWSR